MASQVGQFHHFPIIVNITGLTTSDFNVDIFNLNNDSADVDTIDSLDITHLGGQYYLAKYLPRKVGVYYIGISYIPLTLSFADVADIEEAPAIVNLSQDFGGVNVLKPDLPHFGTPAGHKLFLSDYLLLVFQSSDWDVGRHDNIDAIAITRLDSSGNWLTTPLAVSPGTYHIVIRNNFGTTKVIKPYLEAS